MQLPQPNRDEIASHWVYSRLQRRACVLAAYGLVRQSAKRSRPRRLGSENPPNEMARPILAVRALVSTQRVPHNLSHFCLVTRLDISDVRRSVGTVRYRLAVGIPDRDRLVDDERAGIWLKLEVMGVVRLIDLHFCGSLHYAEKGLALRTVIPLHQLRKPDTGQDLLEVPILHLEAQTVVGVVFPPSDGIGEFWIQPQGFLACDRDFDAGSAFDIEGPGLDVRVRLREEAVCRLR